MFQPKPGSSPRDPVIKIGDKQLKVVLKFCYLGSFLSQNACIDDEIASRISKASASFGRLHHRLWSDHGIRLSTKIGVYRTVVLTTLLYGSESWTWYLRHVKKTWPVPSQMPPKNLWHLLEGQNTKHYCTRTLRDRRYWSFAHQGPTPMGWTSYSHGGKQNTKGTLLRGAGRWSAFTRRSTQEVQGCFEIQPEGMWYTHWNLGETSS